MVRINVAVSGKFHYHNYIGFLHQLDVLNRFYYSHKITTNAAALGVPGDKLVNIWLKEYLVQLHSRYLDILGAQSAKHLYRHLWQKGSLRRWSRCDLLHIMLHGGGRAMIARAKAEGSVILGEPVNVHPLTQNAILGLEYERMGIRKRNDLSVAQRCILEEADAVDHLLVASGFVKRSFVENGFDENKISILPYAVNLARFKRIETDPAPVDIFRVICVAGINIRKGVQYLLEAWRLLNPGKDSELLLVGRIDPQMFPVLRRYQGMYRHLSFVPNSELRKFYSNSSVFVLPSVEDGFGLACTEAMACGLPIIATTNTGASEIIEEGREGFVVPVRSPEALAEKMRILMEDREKAVRMGQLAEQKVQSMYNWQGYAERLAQLYEKLISQGTGQPPVCSAP